MSEYRVYVHGRPQGQDFWSVNEDPQDRFYLNKFLDSHIGSDVTSSMIVDIIGKNSYYTYIHCKNVVENTGRPGAYFAITIRFDGTYCKCASTLYNLFDQIYKKVCTGDLVEVENGFEKLVFNQFAEKSDSLKKIYAIIAPNVDKKIVPYLSSLDESRDTKNSETIAYSLTDVDSPTFISDSFQHKIVFSPMYKSKDKVHDEDVLKLKPLENECLKLKKEVSDWEAKHSMLESKQHTQEEQINSLSKEVKQLNADAEKIKERVEAQYKPELERKEKDLKNLQKQLEATSVQLNTCKVQLDTSKTQLSSLQKELELSKKDSLSHHDKEDLLRQMAERFPNLESTQPNSKPSIFHKICDYLPIVICILLLCAISLGCIIYTKLDKIPNQVNQVQQPLAPAQPTHEVVTAQQDFQTQGDTPQVQPQIEENVNYFIDLQGYSSKRKIHTEYTCALKKQIGTGAKETVTDALTWEIVNGNECDASIQNGRLTMNDSSKVVIVCKNSSGQELCRREITR